MFNIVKINLKFCNLSLFVLFSHNTKTTSWLDPRSLDKSQKPLEESEDDGMSLCAHNYPECHVSDLLYIYLSFALKQLVVFLFKNENLRQKTLTLFL